VEIFVCQSLLTMTVNAVARGDTKYCVKSMNMCFTWPCILVRVAILNALHSPNQAVYKRQARD
jgi:hypothetical protein